MTYEAPVQANAPTNTTVTGEYGGNISQMTWQTRGREKQSYTFKYDYINRMTEADYADISNAGAITNDRYTEKLTYDIRGNIQTLQRYGYNNSSCAWGQIDNLVYQYDPYNQGYNPYNKVYKITDYSDVSKGFVTQSNGSAYSYDVDGNMTADPNKGITGITYNHLNLPTLITFTNNRTITFLYDASGNKLRKTVNNNGTVLYTQDYVNGIEYKNGALESIFHSEGRVTTIDNVLKYEYAMKDHLGNTRLMFCDRNGDGVIKPENAPEASEVTQENSYYAFGMNMEFGAWENTPSVTDNLHQYNGKELNTDFGLNWNDYGARFYDPATARWNVIDPKSENYKSWSPYNYTFNNPIRFTDPTGMGPETDYYNQSGKKIGTDGVNNGKTVVVTDKKEIKDIQSADKKGGTTLESSIKSGITLPSASIRASMGLAVGRSNAPSGKDTKGGFHEEGGRYGKDENGNYQVVDAKPGEKSNPATDGKATVDVADRASPGPPYIHAEGTYHVHPSGEVITSAGSNSLGGGSTANFEQNPSPQDYEIAKNYEGNNSYILGARDGTVTIYNGSGTLATFPLNKFTSVGNNN